MNQTVKQDPKSYARDAVEAFRVTFRSGDLVAAQRAFGRLATIVNAVRTDLRAMANTTGIVLEDCPGPVQSFISGKDDPDVFESTAEFIAEGLADGSFENWPAGETFVAMVDACLP